MQRYNQWTPITSTIFSPLTLLILKDRRHSTNLIVNKCLSAALCIFYAHYELKCACQNDQILIFYSVIKHKILKYRRKNTVYYYYQKLHYWFEKFDPLQLTILQSENAWHGGLHFNIGKALSCLIVRVTAILNTQNHTLNLGEWRKIVWRILKNNRE